MRSVVVLALLWQTAVVLGLGAIHALDNNNKNNNIRASSALPWVGKEVWSTDIKYFSPTQLFKTDSVFHMYGRCDEICTARLMTLDVNDGNLTLSGTLDGCKFMFAEQSSYIAMADGTSYSVFASPSSANGSRHQLPTAPRSVTPMLPLSGQAKKSVVFSVGDHFFGFTTYLYATHVTTLTKIDPQTDTFTINKSTVVPNTDYYAAGLNHLFAMAPETYTVYCYSAATGGVIWTDKVTQDDFRIVLMAPAPNSDIVLLVYSNYFSFFSSLFDSVTGERIWTANVTDKNVPYGGTPRALFTSNAVILQVGGSSLNMSSLIVVDTLSGKVLWETSGFSAMCSCGLESSIFITVVSTKASTSTSIKFSFIGFDSQTGKKVLDYTPTLGTDYQEVRGVRCSNNDVFFVAVSLLNTSFPNSIMQRITFAPHP